ncbi:hypothetical protein [Clostridium lundense]|uniref:hypothetical protein n=1 Tax=Clostridium lundense TaxID=319475 RepID=UPI000686CAE2|nr:hypothetical protein [Clostridium lundense]
MIDNFEQLLKNKKVISKDDVLKIKKYIEIKFKNSSSKEQASVLSSTINDVIINSLKGIKNELKNELRIDILKNTFLINKNVIYFYDVFLVIISTNFKDKISIEEILQWINFSIDKTITEVELKIYLGIDVADITEKALAESVSAESTAIEETSATEIININNPTEKRIQFNNTKLYKIIGLSALIFLITGYSYKKINYFNSTLNKKNIKVESNKEISLEELNTYPGIPEYFRYREIKKDNLKNFLKEKNSLLMEEPYFSTILKTSKEFNLNPLILFSITGQEQNFVPKSEKNAKKIANNPFNVFHSWYEYNTNISDSSRIAARTVLNLCKDRPPKEDPFKWINKKYAEDKNWWKGVKGIYQKLDMIVKG